MEQTIWLAALQKFCVSRKLLLPIELNSSENYTNIPLDMNSGSSRDWIKGVNKINASFTIELRDQGIWTSSFLRMISLNIFFLTLKGYYAFILPPEQIIPNCLEIFDGIKAMIGESRTIGYL